MGPDQIFGPNAHHTCIHSSAPHIMDFLHNYIAAGTEDNYYNKELVSQAANYF